MPALIVSTAAGLLVTKAGVAGSADKALLAQLSDYPKALGMSGAVPAFRCCRSSRSAAAHAPSLT